MAEENKQHLATLAVHGGQEPDPTTGSRAVPIYQTTSYVSATRTTPRDLFGLQEFGNIYTRIMNPTTDVLREARGGAGRRRRRAGDGLRAGGEDPDHPDPGPGRRRDRLGHGDLYGGTYNLLSPHAAEAGHQGALRRRPTTRRTAQRPSTTTPSAVYAETIGNPKLDIVDFERAIAAIASDHGMPLVVDNTVATPYLCGPSSTGRRYRRPLGHQIHRRPRHLHRRHHRGLRQLRLGRLGRFPDFVEPDPSYHGLTFVEALRQPGLHPQGPRAGPARHGRRPFRPFNAWLFLQGLETLHLRMERHSQNALAVAQLPRKASRVSTGSTTPVCESTPIHARRKKYLPNGQGALLGFGIKGGHEAGKKFINSVKLFSHLANIGDAKIAGHSSGLHHPPATDRRGAGHHWRHARVDSPLGRH